MIRRPATPASHDILQRKADRCACGGSCPRCQEQLPNQTKLAISEPGDISEREADRIAGEVMATPAVPAVVGASSRIQRFAGQATGPMDAVPDSVNRTLANPGRPLERALRQDMEQRFGYGFSDVHVHVGDQAERSAHDVGADAYAVGRDIVFGAGKYEPGTAAGKHLLAHELTHVIQQTGSTGSSSAAAASKNRRLARYRSKGKDTIAFDAANETLTDPKTQPWIENITIVFNAATIDTGHKAAAIAAGQLEPRMPTGTLTAKYSAKSSTVLPDVVLPIAGGSTMLGVGLTDRVKASKVTRLEGLGYTDSENIRQGNLTDPVATTGKGARYSASGAGTMNFAIFFKGIQAIHEGFLNAGSHACVHVGSQPAIRDINHHSRIDVTTVTVTYDSAVLDDLCCHRKNTGNARWNANPCEKTKCP